MPLAAAVPAYEFSLTVPTQGMPRSKVLAKPFEPKALAIAVSALVDVG